MRVMWRLLDGKRPEWAEAIKVVLVQPSEPASGPVQQPGAPPLVPAQPGPGPVQPAVPPPGPPVAGRPRNRRMRLVLAMVAGLTALLCLGGVGVFISLYDEATEIDRATPDQVTSSFLRAYLGGRNDDDAALYTCKSGADLTAIAALRAEMIDREQRFGTTVSAEWGSLTVTDTGSDQRVVSTDLIITGWSNGQEVSSRSEPWDFKVVDDDGWRVCAAMKSI